MTAAVVGLAGGLLLLAAVLWGIGPVHHRGDHADVWFRPPGGAAGVAGRARQLVPVVFRWVRRIGPVVIARTHGPPPPELAASRRPYVKARGGRLATTARFRRGAGEPPPRSAQARAVEWDVWRVGTDAPYRRRELLEDRTPNGLDAAAVWRRTAYREGDDVVMDVRPMVGSEWRYGIFDGDGKLQGVASGRAIQ